jgi:hypothetical protein
MLHYFNYLPESNVPLEPLYRHPVYPISCTPTGAIIPDEGHDITFYTSQFMAITEKDSKKLLHKMGAKAKVVWECYHGIRSESGWIFHKNGNLLDFNYGNIVMLSQLTLRRRPSCRRPDHR